MSIDTFVAAKSTSTLAWSALILLIASSALLDGNNPRNEIRKRLKDDYFSTDMTPAYRPSRLFRMLSLYEKDDFEAHKGFLSRHDLIYPVLYGFFMAIMLAYLQGALAPGDDHRIKYLWAIPLGAMLFDYLENGSMYLILKDYDKNSVPPISLAIFSSTMTTFKIFFLAAALVLLLTGAVGLLLKKVWHLRL